MVKQIVYGITFIACLYCAAVLLFKGEYLGFSLMAVLCLVFLSVLNDYINALIKEKEDENNK